jgi:Flp pilus assembly pilin Flp
MSLFKKLLRDARGTAAVELGLILGLIVIAIVGSISNLGNVTSGSLSTTASKYAEASAKATT